MLILTPSEIEELASLLPYATDEEADELYSLIVQSSPAATAIEMSKGRWKMANHLALLNEKLCQVATGQITRLMVTMPPRHGKSELVSKYFPAWYLGIFPRKRIILGSYEADFAMLWGRKTRDLLKAEGPELFGISVRKDSTAADRWSIDYHEGGMDTAGVGGAMTGKGADVLIIDDPVKNAEQANSQVYRDKTWEWYISTAYTRLEPGGSCILIQTRWHADDLAGRVLANAASTGEPWEVLNLPALAEDNDPLGRQPGEALWPERYSAETLLQIKATQNDPAAGQVRHWFECLYQQRPVPAEGGHFRRSWFRYWEAIGDIIRCGQRVVRSVDLRRFGVVDLAFSTKKEADYTVVSAWGVTPHSDLLLLDLHRDRMEGPDIIPAIRRMVDRHNLEYVCIEANGAQLAIIQAARQAGLTVRALKADTDKISRSVVATVRMEAETVYFPRQAPWLADYEAELLSFPRGTHDDMVDVTSYAAIEVQRFGSAAEPDDERQEREAREAELLRQDRLRQWEANHTIDNPVYWESMS